jgi:hypothetical protein
VKHCNKEGFAKLPDTRSAMEQSTCLATVERGALFFDNGIEMLWKTK